MVVMSVTGFQVLGESTAAASQAASFLQGNIGFLILGLILIAATIALLYFFKQVIVNSILGLVAWIIISYVLPIFGFSISLPFWPSLIVSALFGLAGIGVMLVLGFLGVI